MRTLLIEVPITEKMEQQIVICKAHFIDNDPQAYLKEFDEWLEGWARCLMKEELRRQAERILGLEEDLQ